MGGRCTRGGRKRGGDREGVMGMCGRSTSVVHIHTFQPIKQHGHSLLPTLS